MGVQHTRLLILGSGPAAYTAAIYSGRSLLNPVVIVGHEPGGQLATTTEVENYPGFPAPIQGPWLMEQMKLQAINVGARVIGDQAVAINLSEAPFRVAIETGGEWTADALIIATGARARWLGLPSEERFKGFGVSACATCDGFFFRRKHVLVIGGGNTAVEEALYMSRIASKVTLVHRGRQLRAERVLQERLFQAANVEIVFSTVLDEVFGDGTPASISRVRVRNVSDGTVSEFPIDGVFVAIGREPATDLVRGQLELKAGGYIQTAPNSTRTNVPGVLAAGDVADDVFRQAVTAAGMGCMAALEAERFLSGLPSHEVPAGKIFTPA